VLGRCLHDYGPGFTECGDCLYQPNCQRWSAITASPIKYAISIGTLQ